MFIMEYELEHDNMSSGVRKHIGAVYRSSAGSTRHMQSLNGYIQVSICAQCVSLGLHEHTCTRMVKD